MGLLDNLFDNLKGGQASDGTGGQNFQQSTYGGLLNNPLLQIGLGILKNNTGHYGAFAPAVGGGASDALKTINDNNQTNQLMQMRMSQFKLEQDAALRKAQQEKAQQDFLNGIPSPVGASTTTSGGYAPVAPTTNATSPNYNLQKLPDVTTTAPADPQQTMLINAVKSGALPLASYLTLTAKDDTHTFVDGGDSMVQVDHNGNPTGLKLPKGLTPSFHTIDNGGSTLATDGTRILGNFAKTNSPDALLTSQTSILNNKSTQAGENARADKGKAATGFDAGTNPFSFFGGQPTTATKRASLQDISDTAKATGKTTAQVTADLKSKGYTIGGK